MVRTILFIFISCLIGLIIWFIMNWHYNRVISSPRDSFVSVGQMTFVLLVVGMVLSKL